MKNKSNVSKLTFLSYLYRVAAPKRYPVSLKKDLASSSSAIFSHATSKSTAINSHKVQNSKL